MLVSRFSLLHEEQHLRKRLPAIISHVFHSNVRLSSYTFNRQQKIHKLSY